MKKLLTLFIASVIGLAASENVSAQFNTHFYKKEKREKGESNWYKRFDIGGHYFFAKANSTMRIGNYAVGQVYPQHLYYGYNQDYNATGYGARLGYYIPLTRTFNKFSLNLSTMVMFSSITQNIEKVSVMEGIEMETEPYSVTSIQIPIGFDVKWGGESTLDKKDWATVSLGGGVITSLNSADNALDKQSETSFRPYVKLEAGFTTGIHWKFYALWTMGKDKFLDENSGNLDVPLSPENPTSYSYVGYHKPSITVGLAFSIGSLFWDKRNKW